MKENAKKIIKYVTPSILSQCAYFLFTIVDGIFVGRGVGTDALGAVNIALPLIMIAGAVFMLVTIGGGTIAAIRLGAKDVDEANQAFMHSVLASVFFGIIFTILGTVFTSSLVTFLGAGEKFHKMASDYIFYYTIFAVPFSLSMSLQGFTRNDGAPLLVMIAVIISTSLNIFLDWLFVFPLKKGLSGAAMATGISQSVAFLILIFHYILKKGNLCFKKFRFDRKLLGKIFLRGLPELFSQYVTPISIFCMNLMLIKYIGSDGVNAFSVIGYIVSFAYAIFFGVSEGIQPLFGQSYGEKNAKDLKYFKRTGILLSFVGSIIVYFLVIILAREICALFAANEATTKITISSIPKYSWSFIFAALNTIVSSYLYSTKRTFRSSAINVLRAFVLIPISVFCVNFLTKGKLIWFTIGIAEAIGFVFALVIMKTSEKNGIAFERE